VFTENACQAVTDDFLTLGTLRAEAAGYEPMFSVHDQCLFWHRPEKGNTVEGLVKAFTEVPEWAPGFPLGAEAAITDFYTK
jgi:DNA polymerase bacteriophage-type